MGSRSSLARVGLFVHLAALVAAGSASASVRIDHVLSTGGTVLDYEDLFPGNEIAVDVYATWTGEGALNGIFVSTGFESTIFQLVSAQHSPTRPFSPTLFASIEEPDSVSALVRLGGLQQPGDPSGIARSVQYGATSPIEPAGAGTNFVTRLTFQVLWPGGFGSIGAVLAAGDTGAMGDALVPGSRITFAPEPSAALLVGLGLAGLSAVRPRAEG